MIAPELRPQPGMTSAPTLTAREPQITLAVPGKDAVVLTAGPGGPSTIARYRTTLRVPSGGRPVSRIGWRLLAADGSCLAWLANTDRTAYADDDVAAFARASGLRVANLGDISFADLHADRGLSLGPGTSPVTSFVAPRNQWFLTGVVAGSVALAIGPFLGGSGGRTLLGVLLGFVGLIVTIPLAQVLGLAQHAWLEHRYRRTHPSDVLRSARRTPGLILSVRDGRLYAHDYLRTWEGPLESASFGPFDLAGETRRRGLLVTWSDPPTRVIIPTPFDAQELAAFAARHRIPLQQPDAGQVPSRPKVDELARTQLADRVGRARWIGPALWVVALAAATFAILGLSGVLALSVGACISLAGLALLIVSGYGLVGSRYNDSLVHPGRT